MREMVLNHASLAAPDRHTALAWLKDLAIGMAQLQRIAQSILRMQTSRTRNQDSVRFLTFRCLHSIKENRGTGRVRVSHASEHEISAPQRS